MTTTWSTRPSRPHPWSTNSRSTTPPVDQLLVHQPCCQPTTPSRLHQVGVTKSTPCCCRSAAPPAHPTIKWALSKPGRGQQTTPVDTVLPWQKSGKAAAAASMEESITEEEQQGVQGDELIGGSAVVKASATLGQTTWETWHWRLAHVVVSTLEVMHKEKCVHGPQLQGDGASFGSCKACMQNKFARFLFPRAEGSAKAPLEVVHMDLVGPMRMEGTEGVLYFLTMVDEWSRFTWARTLSKKSDAAAAIKEDWLPMVERQAMRLVKVLRSDRGTPQQNGIAERASRTIGEAAKTLLGAAGMPYKFWPEAVCHVITV
ncbi:unnamed protein product [Closterium sp. NIES-54]